MKRQPTRNSLSFRCLDRLESPLLQDGEDVKNAAYSLHHIVSEPHEGDERDRVLYQIYLLNPLGFVLLEGNADHNIDDFFQRCHNCWQLYGAVFDMVMEKK